MSTFGTRHAVVIGGSMAGLVAARTLAEHFQQVTVLERRHRPGRGESTAAQGQMLHLLLESGAAGLEQMLPGIRDELRRLGAVDGRYDKYQHWNEGYRRSFDSAITCHMASRGLLETAVRERVAAIPNVTSHHGATATGLMTSGASVVGVRTHAGDIPADLVVDCSGRSSKSPGWLADAGFPSPEAQEVGVDVWYACTTAPYHPELFQGEADLIVTQPDISARPRGGAAVRIEGGRWMVVLAGYFGDRPPTDPAGYLAYAESLPVGDLATLLRRAADTTPIVTFNFKSSRRRHYERTPPPQGLLALGDSMCSFNPLYGQGMAVAVLQAVALHGLLAKHGNSPALPRAASRAFSKIIDNPWQIAVDLDLAYPETTGRRTPLTRLSNRYRQQTLRATTVDPVVSRRLIEVQHSLPPRAPCCVPTSWFAPCAPSAPGGAPAGTRSRPAKMHRSAILRTHRSPASPSHCGRPNDDGSAVNSRPRHPVPPSPEKVCDEQQRAGHRPGASDARRQPRSLGQAPDREEARLRPRDPAARRGPRR